MGRPKGSKNVVLTTATVVASLPIKMKEGFCKVSYLIPQTLSDSLNEYCDSECLRRDAWLDKQMEMKLRMSWHPIKADKPDHKVKTFTLTSDVRDMINLLALDSDQPAHIVFEQLLADILKSVKP